MVVFCWFDAVVLSMANHGLLHGWRPLRPPKGVRGGCMKCSLRYLFDDEGFVCSDKFL